MFPKIKNPQDNVRVRFAPSPTGELHLGGARTALSNFLYAKSRGGKFLLRIEDTDLERSKKSFTDQIIDSIEWLGMRWDEEIVFQSNRSDHYKKYTESLLQSGAAYRCFATKDELVNIRAQTDSYQYNGLWRDRDEKEINEQLANGVPYTIRLKTPEIGSIKIQDMIYGDIRVSNTEIDDFIIVRSDGSPVYNFTNVIDDNEMRITHVIRGEDHISNTPKQIHIYSALGWGIPKFAHLPMILGQDKKRLSKRHGAASVESYRGQGFQPEALLNYLALLGWNPGTDEEIMDLSKIISKFDFGRVQKKSAVFDEKKLNWISSQYLINQDVNETLNEIRAIKPEWGKKRNKIFCLNVIKLMAVRSTSLRDIIAGSEYFFKAPKTFNNKDLKKVWNKATGQILTEICELYTSSESWNEKNIEKVFKKYIENSNYNFGQVMKPMRLAICGSLTGPSLFEIMELLGNEDSIKRLNYIIKENKIYE